MQKSEGTEAFIAEFDRLLGKCIGTSERARGLRCAHALAVV
jgi:hypothetical protein